MFWCNVGLVQNLCPGSEVLVFKDPLSQSREIHTGRVEVEVYFLINLCLGGQEAPEVSEVAHNFETGPIDGDIWR